MELLKSFILFLVGLSATSALPHLSALFEYHEGDRYFATRDVNGNIKLVDLEVTDLDSKFDPEKDVHFKLYTRANPITEQEIINGDVEGLSSSNFDHNKPTKILSHGWLGSSLDETCTMPRKTFLEAMDVNIICIDWSIGASALYPTSVSYVPTVGKTIANLIDWLIAQGSTVNQFHVVGHSLGGQLVGFVGRSVTSGTIPYITSLDPAMPLWGITSDRLRLSDAGYVEVIHTNSRQLGLWAPIGHADFYPNGGKVMPGCTAVDLNCSHGKSVLYFAYSIDNTRFMADQCMNDEEIENGSCTVIGQGHMGGAQPKSLRGVYALKTTADPPYYVNASLF